MTRRVERNQPVSPRRHRERKNDAKASTTLLLTLLMALVVHAAMPVVTKVDPPNWFTDLKMKNVMLLVQGHDLQGVAAAAPKGSGLETRVLSASANGHFLFLEVTVGAKARPGQYSFRLGRGQETAVIPFSLRQSGKSQHEPAGFSPRDAVYLIMPDRFADGNPDNNVQLSNATESSREQPRGWHGGDLAGITAHLDYLRTLGVTAIWLTPICENAGPVSYHGYHATDFYRVDPHFGTMAELTQMVARAHAAGLKVIQDQVVNHTGPTHPWVDDPPTPTWFNGTRAGHLSCDWNIPGLASPHSTQAARDVTVKGWFAGILPDLNGEDPLLVRYLIQNSIWWVAESSIDGIRLDTYPYTDYNFWKRWFPALRREFPRLTMVGEVMEWQPPSIAYWQKGFRKTDGTSEGPDSLMDFCAMRAMQNVYQSDSGWDVLREVYRLDYLYPAPEKIFTLLDNHDTPRYATTVGNPGALYRNAMAVNLLLRGIPQIYSGGELGLEGQGDPDNRRDFPGGFPGAAVNAFTGAGLTEQQQNNLAWTRRVLTARAACPALQSGTFIEVFMDKDVLLVLKRSESSAALLLFYRGSAEREFRWESPDLRPTLDGAWRSALGGEGLTVKNNRLTCPLAPYEVKLWLKQ